MINCILKVALIYLNLDNNSFGIFDDSVVLML